MRPWNFGEGLDIGGSGSRGCGVRDWNGETEGEIIRSCGSE